MIGVFDIGVATVADSYNGGTVVMRRGSFVAISYPADHSTVDAAAFTTGWSLVETAAALADIESLPLEPERITVDATKLQDVLDIAVRLTGTDRTKVEALDADAFPSRP